VGQLRVGLGYMDEVPSPLKNDIVDGKGELFHTNDEEVGQIGSPCLRP